MPIFTRTSNMDASRDPGPAPESRIPRIAELRIVHEAMAWFRRNEHKIASWQMEVTAIPSPPFGEEQRSRWVRARFEELGLTDVHRDELGNVFGIRPGLDAAAKFLAVSAHIDTVFPEGSPIEV